MNIGVIGYGRPSNLQKAYEEWSDFTAIRYDGLREIYNKQMNPSQITDTYENLTRGLSRSDAEEIKKCVDILCSDYQQQIVIKAIEKVNYEGSRIFTSGLTEQETTESIDELKDSFHIVKIYPSATRKIANYFLLCIDLQCDEITFNSTRYILKTKVLVKNDPFDFKVTYVDFDVVKKEGE